MKNEERDIYTIPPNFIEGGTLMGGMFKSRNVIEAGILAVLIGGPVLSLHFSLTVRIPSNFLYFVGTKRDLLITVL